MVSIKIENLKEGMVIKNYKELCNILDIKVSAGNTKKAQINELSTYCNFAKEGNKYIINEIYKQQTITLDQIAKNSKYIKIIGNKYIYIMSEINKNNFIEFLKHEFSVQKPNSLYKYIKLRIEDFNNNHEESLSYFTKECDVSLRALFSYNKKLIDYGFLIEDGKINKVINKKVSVIKVQKNNIDTKIVLKLRNEFTKYIGRIYKETKCNICGNNKNLELHHLDKSFSVILGECINILGLNYNVTDNEYNILSNMMLGLQIKQEYKTLCKDCHSKYHELYVKQNKYKINKDNNLYKIIDENKLD